MYLHPSNPSPQAGHNGGWASSAPPPAAAAGAAARAAGAAALTPPSWPPPGAPPACQWPPSLARLLRIRCLSPRAAAACGCHERAGRLPVPPPAATAPPARRTGRPARALRADGGGMAGRSWVGAVGRGSLPRGRAGPAGRAVTKRQPLTCRKRACRQVDAVPLAQHPQGDCYRCDRGQHGERRPQRHGRGPQRADVSAAAAQADEQRQR